MADPYDKSEATLAAEEARAWAEKMYNQTRDDTKVRRESEERNLQILKGNQLAGTYDPGQFNFMEDNFALPDQFGITQDFLDKHEMPGEFSFSADEFRDDPFYQFLQQEGQQGVERSKAARGGLASAGTLYGLQDRAQDIAGKFYGDEYNRQADTYGTNMNRALGERAFDYGTSKDVYGMNMNRALNERSYNRGKATDTYNRDVAAKDASYNRQANLAGYGSTPYTNTASSNQALGSQMGNISGQEANMNMAQQMNQQQMEAQSDQAFWNNALGLGQLGIGAGMLFSDRRLKKNIKKIGKYKKHNVYSFEYIWDNVKQIGVMAQEVLKIKPSAVVDVNGYLAVNYGEL